MKKNLFFTLTALLFTLFSYQAKSQLADGTIAPDWTLKDINGVSYHLYDYLNAGKTVVIDISATWCGPCWNYHTSGALDAFYTAHGPSGDNTAMVFFIEGDQSSLACIQGTGSSCGNSAGATQGNWTTGVAYPIIPTYAPNGNAVCTAYNITYFPTCYMICPADKRIKDVDQYTTAQLNTAMAACPSLTVAPVAGFSVLTPTANCTGTIMFNDTSTVIPNKWHWDFGDGDTSNVQNPTHKYKASGTYSVSLKAYNNYGNNTATKNNYITVSLPASCSVTNGSTVSGGSVTLTASGSGTLKWYDAPTGGNLVNTGTSFTINPLTTNKTFYVENDVTQTVQSVGMAAKGTTGGYYTSTAVQGEIFDAYTPFTIQSATVYANTTASRTIYLATSSGTILDSLVTSITSGTQSVNIGFHVPIGKGYVLSCSKNNSLWRETSGAVFPYTAANVMSMTTSTAGSAYYYYFYKWQILADPCTSARVPVTATVTTGINEVGAQVSYNLFPNPNTGEFTLNISSLQNQKVTINLVNINGKTVYSDMLNIKGELNKKFDFTGYSKGIYFMRIIANNEVYNEKIIIQ